MGFAAEIKEFLGAAKDSIKLMSDTEKKDAETKYTQTKTAETQQEMDDPLNQQLKEAKLAHTKATTANIGRESPLDALRRQQIQLEIDAARNPPEYAPARNLQPIVRTYRPAWQDNTGGAVGTGFPGADTGAFRPAATGGLPAVGGFGDDPSLYRSGGSHARGGLVRKFDEGGLVEDEDLQSDEPAIGGPLRATDFSAQSRSPAVGGVPMPRPKPNALTDGLKYNAAQIDRAGVVGGGRRRALRGYASGAGAAPVDDMVQIYRKIDPNGEMGESERNLYALNIVHQFKMNQGDPEGAARTAGQMLQHYKQAATRYAAITAAASETGDVDATMKAALKAYAQVPDGNDMKMSKTKDGHINWEVTGPDGKKITGGLATPEEIGATAMGLATPGGFENYLVQMASGAKLGGGTVTGGARGKKPEETGQADTPKPSEYRELKQEQTDKAVDDWYAAYLKGPEFKANGGKESTPKELASAKNMLYHIRRNNDVTDDEGLRRIQTIISAPEPTKKGEAPPFRAVEDKENKTWNVQFPDGGELSIPSTQIGMFKSARVENLQAKAAAAKAAAEKADRKSGLEMADEAFNKAALGTAADVKERAGRVAENFPNAAKNVREGVEGIAGVAGEAGDWLKRFAQAGPGGSMIGGTGYEGPGDVYGEVNKAVGGVGSKIGRAATAADEALKGGAGHLVGRAIGRALTGPATAVPTDPYEDRPL